MKPSKSQGLSLGSSRSSRGRAPSPGQHRVGGKSAGSRETSITDPGALLAALENAEKAEREARVAQNERAVEMRHVAARKVLALVAATEPEPKVEAPVALPALRQDERVGHRSETGVVVIIRRRRAA